MYQTYRHGDTELPNEYWYTTNLAFDDPDNDIMPIDDPHEEGEEWRGYCFDVRNIEAELEVS